MNKQEVVKLITFEKYLEEECWESEGVLDDDMSDAFELWLTELGVDELIEYANKFEQAVREETIKECVDSVKYACCDKCLDIIINKFTNLLK